MDDFDLMLVHMQKHQLYFKIILIHSRSMYTWCNSPIHDNMLKKNQYDSIKKRTVKLLNYSAKNHTDIKMDQ